MWCTLCGDYLLTVKAIRERLEFFLGGCILTRFVLKLRFGGVFPTLIIINGNVDVILKKIPPCCTQFFVFSCGGFQHAYMGKGQ